MYLATAMLAESTAGSTQKELLDALGSADAAELRKQASLLYQHTAFQKDDAALLLSNSFWINSRLGFSYHDSLFETLADHYDAEGYAVPFGTDAAAEQVSEWIADKSRGRLKEQIAAADNPLTTLILINTALFQQPVGAPAISRRHKRISGNRRLGQCGLSVRAFCHKRYHCATVHRGRPADDKRLHHARRSALERQDAERALH